MSLFPSCLGTPRCLFTETPEEPVEAIKAFEIFLIPVVLFNVESFCVYYNRPSRAAAALW